MWKGKKRGLKKLVSFIMALSLIVTSLSVYAFAKSNSAEDADNTKHSQYTYLISESTGKIVRVNDSTDLVADGDISMLEDVESMPDNALFELVDSTDNRFEGFKSLRSVWNNQAVSARNVGEGGLRANGGQSTTGWEVMRFEAVEDGKYAIRTANGYSNDVSQGAYVKLDENNELIPGNTNIAEAEKFTIVFPKGYVEDTTAQKETPKPDVSNPDESQSDEEKTTVPAVTDGRRHGEYMYLVSVSTNKVLQIDETTKLLMAKGDISMLNDVAALPDTALFYTVEGTDNRFENYVALRSPYNNQSISGQAGGLIATGGNATTGWEILKFVMQDDGTAAILSTNGDNYVTVNAEGKLIPDAKTVGEAQKFRFVLPMNYDQTPSAPEVTVKEREMNAVTLDWSVDAGFYTGFEIYRSESREGNYEKIADSVATEYTDTALASGVTYYYKVVTVCEGLKSADSEIISAKTLTSPKAKAPVNIDISYKGKEITLTWDNAEYASSYEIYRSTGKYSTYEKIGTAQTNTYTETVEDSVYKYYYKVVSVNADDLKSEQSEAMSLDIKLFGDTLNLYSPTDDVSVINHEIKAISDVQMKASLSEFTDNRYAILFKPGDYNINTVSIGFYTQVLGLGKTPYETKIRNINVDKNESENVLINFWRGIENLYVESGSSQNEVKYGASQAAPMRRLYVNGKLHLDDIGTTASGGFLADTYVTGQTGSWSQQQFFVRNTHMTDSWYDSCWNMLFLGCYNAPASSEDWANTGYKAYTTIDKTPVVREKPFLYVDDNGEYAVFVPGIRQDSSDVSWSRDNMGEGTSISINDFYVAKADSDNAETINAALRDGKHIIFTPGIYEIEKPLEVSNPNTVILGLGLATLVCKNTDTAIKAADADGITIAGLIIEAGAQGSETLIQVGEKNAASDHSANPILLSDLFFRVGGTRIGKTERCLEINSDDVIGDHFWIWRADHGAGANWTESTAKNGLVVNGDDVTVYGLFVEHFQQYQTLWNGNNGRTYFYQSELPYDVPYQSDWMGNDGKANGYASYKVADHVAKHEATALGIYEVFIYTKEFMTLDNAMEVSNGTKVTNACTVSLSGTNPNGKGKITHIVNGQGGSVGTGGISQTGAKVGINSYINDANVLKEELQQFIDQYENTQKDNAAEDVWQNFQTALKNAKETCNKADADQSDITSAKSNLEKAYQELQKSKQQEEAPVVSDKKGVSCWYYASENNAQRNVGILGKVGATWLYNWGITESAARDAKEEGLEYVPMVWNGGFLSEQNLKALKAGAESGLYEHLLGFNEPDLSDQANMTVDEAIALWPKLEETGLKLGSPAGAAVEDAWVEQFMEKAKELGYRVDFLTLHVYQDFTHPGSVQSFKEALERLHNKYNIPIWITELGAINVEPLWWGYTNYGPLTHEASTKYIKEVTDMLESLDYVERYAWFVDSSSDIVGTEYTRLFDTNTGELTQEGVAYKKAGKTVAPSETTIPIPEETTIQNPETAKPEAVTTSNDVTPMTPGATSSTGESLTTKSQSTSVPGNNLKKTKIKKAKKYKKRSIKIKLKRVKGATGYKIQFSTGKKFKKAKTKTVYTKKIRFIQRKLKANKKYYIRAKAYKLVGTTKVYSKKWSKVKKVKTR